MTDEQIALSQEKEMQQNANDQKKFERYQMKNLGNYEKLYPIEIPQDADEEKRVKLEA